MKPTWRPYLSATKVAVVFIACASLSLRYIAYMCKPVPRLCEQAEGILVGIVMTLLKANVVHAAREGINYSTKHPFYGVIHAIIVAYQHPQCYCI